MLLQIQGITQSASPDPKLTKSWQCLAYRLDKVIQISSFVRDTSL